MRITEAIEEICKRAGEVCAHRPGADHAFFIDPVLDPERRTVWFFWAHSVPYDPMMAAGAGFGIEIFKMGDVLADDWEVITLEEARKLYDTREKKEGGRPV